MKTGSSALVGVQFPFELRDAINSFAKNTDKSPSWHIRQACILYLAANGMNVSNLDNPEGRGVRSDIKKRLTKEQEHERLRYLIEKKRKEEGK